MFLDGHSMHASVGPYPEQCITAPSTCESGFTFAMWLKKSRSCISPLKGIVSTLVQNQNPTEGILIKCHNNMNKIKYCISIHPNSESTLAMILGSGSYEWVFVTMVWSVGSPVDVYENGQFVESGNWRTDANYVRENTRRELVFGSLYTDNITGHARAYIDGVRMYNRPLSESEVQTLYLTFAETETTTDLTTAIEQNIINETDLLELNMELGVDMFTGNAEFNPLERKVPVT